jgi:hypothetical protein
VIDVHLKRYDLVKQFPSYVFEKSRVFHTRHISYAVFLEAKRLLKVKAVGFPWNIYALCFF